MIGYLIFWGVSALTLVAFMAYWIRRIEREHWRRMAAIAAAEEETRVWAAKAAQFRAEYLAAEGRGEPATELPSPRSAPAVPGAA